MKALAVLVASLALACGGARTGPRGGEAAEPRPDPASPSATVIATGTEPSASPAASVAQMPTPTRAPSQISARHILVQYMGCAQAPPAIVRTREQALAVIQEVLAQVKAGADFGRLAVEFSDEPNAGRRGGSLGRFGHGSMDKKFEEAAFALSKGQVSGVVESAFGFHVIQRTE